MDTPPRMAASLNPTISVVVPVYRNAPTLHELTQRVRFALCPIGLSYELVFVDDASPDAAGELIATLRSHDPCIQPIRLTHNVGQQRAVLLGLRQSRGDWVVVMDADLQDPPEAIPAILERGDAGYDVVFAGRSNRYQSPGRMITSRLYKYVQHAICGVPLDAGMYMALSRAAVDRLLRVESAEGLSLVAMVGLCGLRSTSVPVARAPRPIGTSSYSRWHRMAVAAQLLARAATWRWRNPVPDRLSSGARLPNKAGEIAQ